MYRHRYHIRWLVLVLTTGLITCREPYAPPAITTPHRFLVVDGFINTGPNTVTTFNLNRTRNLGDSTVRGIPELNAQFSIIGSNGNVYPLKDAGTGAYSSGPLTLDATKEYHISITTTDGQQYSSDQVPCEATPPIDSVFWRQPFDLTIYVSTHDPTDNTHYYRYDYNETWEHDSQLFAEYAVVNGRLYEADSADQKNRCWTTDTSSNILLTSSAALTSDVIDSFAVLTIPNSDPRVDIAYSIIVRQYALTQGAYNYWQLIQKTTDNVGTLFDVQPTQLTGNIHCTSNPAEPVIGYLSACSVQQQRILTVESGLHDWTHNQPGFGCDTMSIPADTADPFIYTYANPNWAPYYFVTDAVLELVSSVCVDCTLVGGTTTRPSFMPD
ncbi:MAG TPA: DUF4249 domain-containing protein [Puia sp.]|jgi:hypothetical protein|nr:DUF4249 domain-containing protein [Puia sp.]